MKWSLAHIGIHPPLLLRARLAAAIALFLILVSSAFAQSDPQFARANDEFAKGEFQDAIHDYESLVQARQWSAPLFYNLGNAYFRTSDFGRAILNYERALALDPQHPETAANLALAREEARALELQRGRFQSLFKHVTANQLTVAAATAFWIGAFAFAAMFLGRRHSIIPLFVALAGFAVTLAGVAIVYEIESSRRAAAVVIAGEVQARLATADNASTVLQLPPGSEVQILSRRGDWVYALLPNNLRGWIPSSAIEHVRL